MTLRRPESGSFEDRLRPVTIEVTSIIRLTRRPAAEPDWSRGIHRFDDPGTSRAHAFGVCYAGSSVDVAFAESVVHEAGSFVGGTYQVPVAKLTERSVVRFRCETRKTLMLADLTGAALKSLGLNNDISASSDYTVTQAWARAIHDASPRWDGIRFVSRQMNKSFAYALFERSGLVKLSAEKLSAQQIDHLCDRFNVTAI